MIYILKGEIRSGKTTALKTWVNTSTALSGTNRTDVDGFLCPDGEDGKRYFLNVKSKAEFELEVEASNDPIVEIGKFKFLKSAFDKANSYLVSIPAEPFCRYIVLDEVGRLELKGEGLHDATKVLIPKLMKDEHQHVIVVVRDYLFEDVLGFYSISEYSVLSKEDLSLLA
ncbi:MAG: nucleoside-triphosphatase [Winogradskyella sp.]|uniref:nucleoside-triphosphatase n=1 Tax=Winogradskyella sp. TaxID=1883156 RepID=UPI003857FDF7